MGKSFIIDNYVSLDEILDAIKVGIYITDEEGNTLALNEESRRSGGLTKNDVVGKNVVDLKSQGYIGDSITIKVLKSGKEESMIQNLGSGTKIYVVGTPVYKSGKIAMVVSTERDITETLMLKELLKEQGMKEAKYKQELEYFRDKQYKEGKDIIGSSRETAETLKKALRVAKLDTTILLTGESGTGKEVYANFIYRNSLRADKPYIKINMAAIPESLMESELFGYDKGAFTDADKKGKMGIFELANSGTIFLDEIGEMPIHLQTKILRVLQEKEIMRVGGKKIIPLDIRIIAATNRDLKAAMEEGKFREDLYYRLNVMPINLKPLRERKADIADLSDYFVNKFNCEYNQNKKLSKDAMFLLTKYDWYGNIRELENIIERLMISFDSDEISAEQIRKIMEYGENKSTADIPIEGFTMKEIMENYESYVLDKMLDTYGRASKVSEKLEIDKSTLSRKLRKYGIGKIHKTNKKS